MALFKVSPHCPCCPTCCPRWNLSSFRKKALNEQTVNAGVQFPLVSVHNNVCNIISDFRMVKAESRTAWQAHLSVFSCTPKIPGLCKMHKRPEKMLLSPLLDQLQHVNSTCLHPWNYRYGEYYVSICVFAIYPSICHNTYKKLYLTNKKRDKLEASAVCRRVQNWQSKR